MEWLHIYGPFLDSGFGIGLEKRYCTTWTFSHHNLDLATNVAMFMISIGFYDQLEMKQDLENQHSGQLAH